jgi:S-adenosylmethionine:tRNA ribosyltransferase-isomerase
MIVTSRDVAGTEDALGFELPAILEARVPPEARVKARDEVRLMVSERDGSQITHASFRDLPLFLSAGDLIVVNDTGTMAAALMARRLDGSTFSLHLSVKREGFWVVEPRETKVERGEVASLADGGRVEFIAPHRDSARLWEAQVEFPGGVDAFLAAHGRPIAYSYVDGEWPLEMYQTVYAGPKRSAEMPSAGRAFSPRVIDALAEKGVGMAAITLHTGVASLEAHEPPYEEWFSVSATTARQVNATRTRGGRVIAVGTTVIRALESAVDDEGLVRATRGWTDLIITPARGVRTIDGLLTGFHEPKATHLSMLEALAGRSHLERAYRAALRGQYLWHEFGDLHLIL